jgi:hypothetical protein
METGEERLTKRSNAIARSPCFSAFFPELRSDIGSRSHNLHAKPGPRDHFQIALEGAAHGMIAAINCT